MYKVEFMCNEIPKVIKELDFGYQISQVLSLIQLNRAKIESFHTLVQLPNVTMIMLILRKIHSIQMYHKNFVKGR